MRSRAAAAPAAPCSAQAAIVEWSAARSPKTARTSLGTGWPAMVESIGNQAKIAIGTLATNATSKVVCSAPDHRKPVVASDSAGATDQSQKKPSATAVDVTGPASRIARRRQRKPRRGTSQCT